MNKIRLFTVIMLCTGLLMLIGCGPKSHQFGEAEIAAIESIIEANMQELLQTAESLKTDAMEKYFQDGQQKNYYMTGVAYTKSELISTTKAMYQNYQGQKLNLIDSSVRILSPTSVLWAGEISGISTDLDGKEETMSYTDTWIWEKIDDKWLATHVHESWLLGSN